MWKVSALPPAGSDELRVSGRSGFYRLTARQTYDFGRASEWISSWRIRFSDGALWPRNTPRTLESIDHNSNVPSKGTRFDRPELDVLRFLAFLMVFFSHAFHSRLFDGGGFGVEVFFLLSAYLITTLLLLEKEKTGDIAAGRFYARRIFRIWPVYYLTLLVAVGLRIAGRDGMTGRFLALFLLPIGNWACVTWGFPNSLIAPLWSVSVEEQFYLAWPFLMRRWLYRLPQIAIGLILVACAARGVLVWIGAGRTATWCNTFAQLDSIATGALVGYYLNGRLPRISAFVRLIFASVSALAFPLAILYGDVSGVKCLATYPIVTAASLGLLLAFLGLPVPNRLWLRYPGKISYGLYAYHLAVLRILPQFRHRWLVALLLTGLIAAISYELLERPILRYKERFAIIRSRAA